MALPEWGKPYCLPTEKPGDVEVRRGEGAIPNGENRFHPLGEM